MSQSAFFKPFNLFCPYCGEPYTYAFTPSTVKIFCKQCQHELDREDMIDG